MGGSYLRHKNYQYRCSVMPVGSHSPAVTVTNVDFNSVCDNSLVSKFYITQGILYYVARLGVVPN